MSNSEVTLILLKPDAIERGLCGEILRRLEQAGLRVEATRSVKASMTLLTRHYAELKVKNLQVFERTAGYLEGRTLIALRITGSNAVAKTRRLTGPTDPLAAPAGTIRGDLSCDSFPLAEAAGRGTLNLMHASDSPDSARRELRLWFSGRTG